MPPTRTAPRQPLRDCTNDPRRCGDCRAPYPSSSDLPHCPECTTTRTDRVVRKNIIRLPNCQTCTFCKLAFAIGHYEPHPNPAQASRCMECRTKERCSACQKRHQRDLFLVVGGQGPTTGLWKTCSPCRTSHTMKVQENIAKAKDQGRWLILLICVHLHGPNHSSLRSSLVQLWTT